ncbi:MAG: hypothetical protein ACP5UO_06440 [Thermoplasmata archaeon]
MEKYKVVERTEEEGVYHTVAIDFREPRYIRFTSSSLIKDGETVEVEGDKVYFEGTMVGIVRERKDSSKARVNTKFDVKYTGGYSLDGKTIYLDEHFPKTLKVEGKEVSTIESIGLHHELPEKWMSDLGYEYPRAHEIATGIEKEYVESLGVTWGGYCREVDRNLRQVYRRKLERSPPSLDLAPYLYCRDREALKEIRDSRSATPR